MPYLKFTRDRRGYEHTYLLHSGKRRGRGRPTLLYWYRTPPHVKVGRAAFDPEAIRLLEDLHPDLEFDWPHILEARPRPAEPEGRPVAKKTRPAPGSSLTPPAAPPAAEHGRQDESPARVGTAEEAAAEGAEGEKEPPSPAAVPGIETPDSEEAASSLVDDNGRPHHASDPSAAEQVLGAEALARLRARYAEILSRIERRVAEPARQQALREQAEAINPDSWVTRAEVQAALETLEQKTADLYRMTGRRRRRRRGRREGGGGGPAAASEGQQANTEREEVTSGGEDEEEQVEN